MSGKGAPVFQHGRHIAVFRGARELWRSAGQLRAAATFALVGPKTIAFGYDAWLRHPSLLIAPLGGRERIVARDEQPLGWLQNGQLATWSYRESYRVSVRAATGMLVRSGSRAFREIRFDRASRTIVGVSQGGIVERYDGDRWRRLADLRRFGLDRRATLDLVARRLIGFVEGQRVVVLRTDGSLFAFAQFALRRRHLSVAGESGLVADRGGRAVAFAVTTGRPAAFGRERVEVLRPGDWRARQVYAGRVAFAQCERWADLAWNGDWLLYATTEGRTIALDARAPRRRVDLTRVVRAVTGRAAGESADAQVGWAD